MNVVLLAAGYVTMLASIFPGTPKILVSIRDEPLLSIQLRYLAREGASRVIMNAHHLAAQVEHYLATSQPPVETTLVVEEKLLGTAGGVRNVLGYLESAPFVVLYGDVLTNLRLTELLDCHLSSGAEATIAVYKTRNTAGKGTVQVARDGQVLSFSEKSTSASSHSLFVNAGVYILEPRFVEESIARSAYSDFGHDIFPQAVTEGRRLFAYELMGSVIDVGTPEGLATAHKIARFS